MSSLEAQITRGNDAKEVRTNQKKAVEEQVWKKDVSMELLSGYGLSLLFPSNKNKGGGA